MKSILKILCLLSFVLPVSIFAQIEISPVFASNMVLPRNKQIPFSGKAKPNTNIEVSINKNTYKVETSKNGAWKVILEPMVAGGPYSLTISEEGGEKRILDNILIGDLWLCAGQSNMQYTLNMINYKEEPDENYNNSNLRLCSIWVDRDYLPRENVSNAVWQPVSKEAARNFSAVGYFFGKHLTKEQDVPIGLISSNLGATAIETWMSIDALEAFPQFDEVTGKIKKINKDFETLENDLKQFRKKWDEKYYLKGPGIEDKWYEDDYDYSDWSKCILPSFWDDFGYADFDGSMWFKRTFDLDSTQLKNDFHLVLNQIDDYDITWVNGVKVGESFGKSNFRNYKVPKNILRGKDNIITVRVFDVGGKGGIYTNPFWGNPILNGEWKYKKGMTIQSEKFPKPTIAQGSPFSHPMLLYNASIAPLHKLPITGVIWYQGESNELKASEYSSLLKAMINDWRNKWNDSSLPFFIVQLANYRQENIQPVESLWAELRESQMKATTLKNVDIVTAIDIGDAYDIHPHNKKEVGRRLSLLALHYKYGNTLINGPKYKSSIVKDHSIFVQFEINNSALKSLDKHGYLRGFSIAGEDGKFQWAKARIIGIDTVEVYNESIQNPKYVRYAWSDNPGDLDLVNQENLPAFPFRTDNLELSTANNVYHYDPHAF
ncbi:MAG TPA: sialate O-acetylesterase [Flavobacteriaceae bacterium]|nr:sialate O-acetylesterase [Flavobacteriaceae bacterium]